MKSMKHLLCAFVLFLASSMCYTTFLKDKKNFEVKKASKIHKKLLKTLSFLQMRSDEEFISEFGDSSSFANENENENESDLFGSYSNKKEDDICK